jgi:hypothetical protein
MQKTLAFALALCLSLTGCQVFEKSRTWETVVSVRPGDACRQADPSSYYAEKLHHVLAQEGVEHIVVTYQYHYYTHQYEEALGTRTAVVYRDDANSSYPWWLKDDRTNTPVWLPNGDLNKQLLFYCRRKAEVIGKQVYPGGRGSGKSSVALHRPQEILKVGLRDSQPAHPQTQKPQPVTKITIVKPAAPQPAKPSVAVHHTVPEKSATANVGGNQATVTKIQRPAPPVTAKPKVASESASATSSSGHSLWSPPTAIDPVQQASDPAPRDEHMEKLFRARNGTSYDPTSAVDRRKMEQLKHGLVGKEVNGERALRRGVDGLPAF